MKKKLVDRRILILIMALAICLVSAYSGLAAAASDSQNPAAYQNPEITTGDQAWEELMKGNQRFVASERAVRNFTGRRAELVTAQHPFATVIACSDSRVPPELLLDQGLGDIFVIRVAGNVVGTIELGSVEYGVEHLHTPLLVVLGHQSCGAVTATVEGGPEGNIGSILEEIEPAVETAKKTNKTGKELVEEAVDENVKLVIKNILDKSPVTRELAEKGKLKIVGAKYFFDTGKVEVIEVVNATTLELAPPIAATPTTPITTPPKTPSFEAVLAISGILVVANLLRRRA